MNEATPVTAYGSWSATEIPFTIEYPLDLLEQISAVAQSGLQRSLRGGLEIGGVLFGTRLTRSIRILAWRRITCEHTRGPKLVLSRKDEAELARSLQNAPNDPELRGLYPLGWFISHPKNGAQMNASDRKIYRQYFPLKSQTTLVLHPKPDGSTRARFFIRDSAGKVQSAKKTEEFTIGPDSPASVAGEEPELAKDTFSEVISNQPSPGFKTADARRARDRKALPRHGAWIWIVPLLLAVLVASMMLPRTRSPQPPPSFSLRASEVGGGLRLEWDRNAAPIQEATRGNLEIKDGNVSVPLELDTQRLRDGYFNYARISGDVEVRMTVYPAKGEPLTEFAKFVGPPVAPPVTVDEKAVVTRDRDLLKAQVEKLQESLRKESARNRQLEDTVRILKQRLQLQKLLESKAH